MDWTLSPHSATLPSNTISVNASIKRPTGANIDLTFKVISESLSDFLVPANAADPKRRDNLWQRTCFELFIRPSNEPAYFEFNFSPSGDWAAYQFISYRDGMRPLTLSAPPKVDTSRGQRVLDVAVTLDLTKIPDLTNSKYWDIGLSAIIEQADQKKSYWALAHPPGKPDFHHPDCFAARIDAMNIE